MPIRMEAYLGAMSRWFTLKPEIANPLLPTAMIRAIMAVVLSLQIVGYIAIALNA